MKTVNNKHVDDEDRRCRRPESWSAVCVSLVSDCGLCLVVSACVSASQSSVVGVYEGIGD